MGLIYVNPEAQRRPDPLAAAATSAPPSVACDERRGDLAPDRRRPHAGKAHGAADGKYVGPEPEGASLDEQGLGWKNAYGTGQGRRHHHQRLEGAWTSTPVDWSQDYFRTLFRFEWELTQGPAGAPGVGSPKGDAGATCRTPRTRPSCTSR